MNIKYLTTLNNTPIIKSKHSDYIHQLVPLSIDEIVGLETIYNNKNRFPASLRELLFLAGQECYVLDYSTYDSQEQMQEDVRADLVEFGRSITRPFFVIDVHWGVTPFLFVYLDEGVEDPIVYAANFGGDEGGNAWITKMTSSLSSLLNARIEYLKEGRNPF